MHPLHHPSAYPQAKTWVEGRGAIITDATGREYLDGLAGLWNVNVGHGRESLAKAAHDQMATLAYCSSYAGSTNYPAIALAERLSQIAYSSINTFFFTSGGAEATESSIKTARFYWKALGKADKTKIISRHRAYHGLTLAAMSATGLPAFWPMFEPRVPGFFHIDAPDPYRFVNPDPATSLGVAAANQLEAAILREGPDTVAAFIAEPIQGAGGVIVPPLDYFPRIREICDRHDVLLIADDVINGVAPGKRWMHAYTYSGHPTCCAVALRNIEILHDERLVERAARLGVQLAERLQQLTRLDGVGHVRSLGLIGAVEIVADQATKALHPPEAQMTARLTDALLERGLYTRVAMDCICIAPPLVISEAQLDRLVDIIADAVPAALTAARA